MDGCPAGYVLLVRQPHTEGLGDDSVHTRTNSVDAALNAGQHRDVVCRD